MVVFFNLRAFDHIRQTRLTECQKVCHPPSIKKAQLLRLVQIVLESCKDKSQTRSHYLPYLLQGFFLLAIQI